MIVKLAPSAKVVLVHNIVAPYRVPLFEACAKYFKLTVVFCDAGDATRKWSQNVNSQKFEHIFLRKVPLGPFIFNRSVFKTLRTNEADAYILIDNEENLPTNLAVMMYAKARHRPYVLWSGHILAENGGIHPSDFHKTFFHRWPFRELYFALITGLNRMLYKGARSYLAYSDSTRKYLEKYNVAPEKIIVGTQAKPRETMPSVTKKIALPKKINILYLGYLRPEKGVEVLLRAVLELPESKVALHIVGDGPEKEKLLSLAQDANNVFFLPYAHGAETANWYSSVDVCVLPTYHDPWAHTVTESLNYGTPVVVTRSAAASSVIESGVTGFVINAGEETAIVEIIKSMIDDPGMIKRMKSNIKHANLGNLYDVDKNAQNIAESVMMALGDKS